MRCLFVMFAAGLLALPAPAADPDPAALLKRADQTRNGWPSFTVRVRITSFEEGKQDEQHLFQVYQKGAEKTYVEFLSPRDKGRHLLMLGDDMWIYLPDTSRPIRITPLERLVGNASNGDVARTNYAADYDAAFLRTEMAGDVRRHVLELTARRKGATYQKIHYWLRAGDARPVRADYFLASGKHTKSATFDDYQVLEGRPTVRRITIYDRIRKTSHSVIEYLEWKQRSLPDRMFHQGRGERF